jgi:hypothetical protein
MNRINIISSKLTFKTALVVLLLMSGSLLAMSGGPYELTWTTIDGGGGTGTGGQYTLTGTLGQPDTAYLEGGGYTLIGGFWSGELICFVNFRQFATFAENWLQTGSGLPADLYTDNIVDYLDLDVFVDQWLCYCPTDWPLK